MTTLKKPTLINLNDNIEENENKDYSRWKIVYPTYLNKKKKIQEGRRINIKYCVNNPTINDIEKACRELKVTYLVEKNKSYPRDWQVEGRIRIKIPDDVNKIYTKIQLMRRIGEKMKELHIDNEHNMPCQINIPKKKKNKKNR